MPDGNGGNLPLPPGRQIERVGPGHLVLAAPAKLNLNLLVGPRREDGYHPIDSLVTKVTLYDQIRLRRRRDGAISFSCQGADCGDDAGNLALRAGRLLAEDRDVPGADIELLKTVPPGKGLGGASSDAAAVLRGLDALWGLSLGNEEMTDLACRLGSDVPLFLGPAASRITGRGEQVEPIGMHPLVAVVYLPELSCDTREVYAAYDRQDITVDQQLDVQVLQSPPSQWRDLLRNQLAPAAFRVCGELARLWEELSGSIPLRLCLTGSGSAMFVLCDDEAEARQVLAAGETGLPVRRVVVRLNPW